MWLCGVIARWYTTIYHLLNTLKTSIFFAEVDNNARHLITYARNLYKLPSQWETLISAPQGVKPPSTLVYEEREKGILKQALKPTEEEDKWCTINRRRRMKLSCQNLDKHICWGMRFTLVEGLNLFTSYHYKEI